MHATRSSHPSSRQRHRGTEKEPKNFSAREGLERAKISAAPEGRRPVDCDVAFFTMNEMRAPSLMPHCDRGQRQQYSKRAARQWNDHSDGLWLAADHRGELGHATRRAAWRRVRSTAIWREPSTRFPGLSERLSVAFRSLPTWHRPLPTSRKTAEARITDADVADNSAALVRNRIRQQAASAGPRTSKPTTRVSSYSAPRVGDRRS